MTIEGIYEAADGFFLHLSEGQGGVMNYQLAVTIALIQPISAANKCGRLLVAAFGIYDHSCLRIGSC